MKRYLNLIQFPVPCEFRNSALGHRRQVKVGSLKGNIYLPTENLSAISQGRSLAPPPIRDVDFVAGLFDRHARNEMERLKWGWYFSHHPKDLAGTAVATVGFAVLAFSEYQSGKSLPLATVSKECLEHLPAWCSRLVDWIEVITKDDLNSAHSIRDSIDPVRWTTAAWITSSVGRPSYCFVNPSMSIFGSSGDRAMTTLQWQVAVRGANRGTDPPDIYLLLRDARAAQMRHHRRRAILDLATAVELIIATALRARLSKAHSQSEIDRQLNQERKFWRRTALMEANGMRVPDGVRVDVMALRNKVIHENASVTQGQSAAAIRIVEELAACYTPLRLP